MNRRETPPGAPHPPIRSGLAVYRNEPTWAYVDMSTIPQTGRSDPPVKPTSEVAHQPGQQPAALCPCCGKRMSRDLYEADGDFCWDCGIYSSDSPEECDVPEHRAARLCGGVQHRETKSAGQTTGGACGGSRLGNPCDGDGLTR